VWRQLAGEYGKEFVEKSLLRCYQKHNICANFLVYFANVMLLITFANFCKLLVLGLIELFYRQKMKIFGYKERPVFFR
jgi:hypothetical protein